MEPIHPSTVGLKPDFDPTHVVKDPLADLEAKNPSSVSYPPRVIPRVSCCASTNFPPDFDLDPDDFFRENHLRQIPPPHLPGTTSSSTSARSQSRFNYSVSPTRRSRRPVTSLPIPLSLPQLEGISILSQHSVAAPQICLNECNQQLQATFAVNAWDTNFPQPRPPRLRRKLTGSQIDVVLTNGKGSSSQLLKPRRMQLANSIRVFAERKAVRCKQLESELSCLRHESENLRCHLSAIIEGKSKENLELAKTIELKTKRIGELEEGNRDCARLQLEVVQMENLLKESRIRLQKEQFSNQVTSEKNISLQRLNAELEVGIRNRHQQIMEKDQTIRSLRVQVNETERKIWKLTERGLSTDRFVDLIEGNVVRGVVDGKVVGKVVGNRLICCHDDLEESEGEEECQCTPGQLCRGCGNLRSRFNYVRRTWHAQLNLPNDEGLGFFVEKIRTGSYIPSGFMKLILDKWFTSFCHPEPIWDIVKDGPIPKELEHLAEALREKSFGGRLAPSLQFVDDFVKNACKEKTKDDLKKIVQHRVSDTTMLIMKTIKVAGGARTMNMLSEMFCLCDERTTQRWDFIPADQPSKSRPNCVIIRGAEILRSFSMGIHLIRLSSVIPLWRNCGIVIHDGTDIICHVQIVRKNGKFFLVGMNGIKTLQQFLDHLDEISENLFTEVLEVVGRLWNGVTVPLFTIMESKGVKLADVFIDVLREVEGMINENLRFLHESQYVPDDEKMREFEDEFLQSADLEEFERMEVSETPSDPSLGSEEVRSPTNRYFEEPCEEFQFNIDVGDGAKIVDEIRDRMMTDENRKNQKEGPLDPNHMFKGLHRAGKAGVYRETGTGVDEYIKLSSIARRLPQLHLPGRRSPIETRDIYSVDSMKMRPIMKMIDPKTLNDTEKAAKDAGIVDKSFWATVKYLRAMSRLRDVFRDAKQPVDTKLSEIAALTPYYSSIKFHPASSARVHVARSLRVAKAFIEDNRGSLTDAEICHGLRLLEQDIVERLFSVLRGKHKKALMMTYLRDHRNNLLLFFVRNADNTLLKVSSTVNSWYDWGPYGDELKTGIRFSFRKRAHSDLGFSADEDDPPLAELITYEMVSLEKLGRDPIFLRTFNESGREAILSNLGEYRPSHDEKGQRQAYCLGGRLFCYHTDSETGMPCDYSTFLPTLLGNHYWNMHREWYDTPSDSQTSVKLFAKLTRKAVEVRTHNLVTMVKVRIDGAPIRLHPKNSNSEGITDRLLRVRQAKTKGFLIDKLSPLRRTKRRRRSKAPVYVISFDVEHGKLYELIQIGAVLVQDPTRYFDAVTNYGRARFSPSFKVTLPLATLLERPNRPSEEKVAKSFFDAINSLNHECEKVALVHWNWNDSLVLRKLRQKYNVKFTIPVREIDGMIFARMFPGPHAVDKWMERLQLPGSHWHMGYEDSIDQMNVFEKALGGKKQFIRACQLYFSTLQEEHELRLQDSNRKSDTLGSRAALRKVLQDAMVRDEEFNFEKCAFPAVPIGRIRRRRRRRRQATPHGDDDADDVEMEDDEWDADFVPEPEPDADFVPEDDDEMDVDVPGMNEIRTRRRGGDDLERPENVSESRWWAIIAGEFSCCCCEKTATAETAAEYRKCSTHCGGYRCDREDCSYQGVRVVDDEMIDDDEEEDAAESITTGSPKRRVKRDREGNSIILIIPNEKEDMVVDKDSVDE